MKTKKDKIIELKKLLEKSIASGPMKLNPTPNSEELKNGVIGLPDTTLIDVRMNIKTYKEILIAIV